MPSKIRIGTLLALCGVLLLASAFIQPIAKTYADTASDLQAQIDARSRNLEQLTKEIQQYQDLADKTSKEAQTLQKKIQALTATGKALDLDIKKTSGKIDLTNLDIKKLDLNITASQKKIQVFQSGIESSIRDLRESDDGNLIQSILSTENLSDFLAAVDSQLSLNDALQSGIQQLRGEKKSLETSKDAKETNKEELVKLQAELSDKKKVLDTNKSEQSKVLTDTKNQEKTYQQILKDRLALKASVEKELFEYEAKLKYTLDPSSIPKAGTSPLSWPTEKVTITQLFGKTVGAEKLYVSGSHNGVDFGAPIGTKVFAVRGGTVAGTGDTDLTCPKASFGRFVFIQHDDGLASIVGHLSVIVAKQGQVVKTGDLIGYSGNTGYTTGPHVHLSVYDGKAVSMQQRPSAACAGKIFTMPIAPIEAYLDPMVYLPPYKK